MFRSKFENLGVYSSILLLSEFLVDLGYLILHELPGDQLLVSTIEFDKLIVGALLDDVSGVHDDDLVSVPDCREPMGDHDNCLRPLRYERVQSRLHLMFALSIEGTGSFVEQQDLWLSHKCPGDGDPLLLASRQAHASFTNFGVKPLWEQTLI